MEAIKIIGTEDTPSIILDAGENNFQILGRSLPEDAGKFYNPIISWMKDYSLSPNATSVFNFKLTYFNTSSSKMLLDILLMLEEMKSKGKDVTVKWYYPEEDEDMQEAGIEYADIVDVPFEQIPYKA
jgi:hypothetical protein